MTDDRKQRDQDAGPSTNEEAVPDGLEGSIMEDGAGSSDRGKGATSKQRGDREEGRERSVHDL